ncbi:hypothetical protein SAMN06272759_106146 [Novosphingobium sp. B1]|nr:hypothetical protein SAMN06272759_106146 [Novosphingobium sp. B1]
MTCFLPDTQGAASLHGAANKGANPSGKPGLTQHGDAE